MNIIKYTAISAFLFVSSNATCNTHSNCAPSDLSYEGYSQCASTDSYANSNGPYAGIEGGILQNITRINNSVGIVHGDDNKLAIYPSATKIQPLKGTGDIFISGAVRPSFLRLAKEGLPCSYSHLAICLSLIYFCVFPRLQ